MDLELENIEWFDKNTPPKENGEYLVEVQMCDMPDVKETTTDFYIDGYWQDYAQFVNRWAYNLPIWI